MNLKESIEGSRGLLRKFKFENPEKDRINLTNSVDFINLLNDGAEGLILNEPLKVKKDMIYRHKAVYEGLLIVTHTRYKISNSADYIH
jgi:hypothetical protein